MKNADPAPEDEARSAPPRNVIRVEPDGPFMVEGDVEVQDVDGTTLLATDRAVLCRCGASGRKPFCDGSHVGLPFADAAKVPGVRSHKPDPTTACGRLVVKCTADGPLLVAGSFDLEGTSGGLGFREGKAALCACGESAMKPLCDGAHS